MHRLSSLARIVARPPLLALSLLLLLLLLLVTPQIHGAESSASLTHSNDSGADSSSAPSQPLSEFQPSSEWQVVEEGQAIPPGLWVRMDMSTGVKTARLMPTDAEEDAESARERAERKGMAMALTERVADPTVDAPTDADGPIFRHHLPTPSDGSLPEPADASIENLQAARQKRLAQLKELFYLKPDVEQMKQLLAVCIDPSSTVSQVTYALELLEDYLHQLDNGVDWTRIGGLDVVLQILEQSHEPSMEPIEVPIASIDPTDATSSNETTMAPPAPADLQLARLYGLQASAALVLGTAAQNNPAVNEACKREQTVQVLTKLYRTTLQEEMKSEEEPDVTPTISLFQLRSARLKLLSKLLFSLSALLRNDARNQAVFQQLGGADLLLHELPSSYPLCSNAVTAHSGLPHSELLCLSTSEHASLRKLRSTYALKALNLVNSLIIDHTINSHKANADASGSASAEQMSDPALFAELSRPEFCARYLAAAGQLDSMNRSARLTGSQLGAREQALQIMAALLEHKQHESPESEGLCAAVWSQPSALQQLRDISTQLLEWRDEAAAEEIAAGSDDSDGQSKYIAEIRDIAERLRSMLEERHRRSGISWS